MLDRAALGFFNHLLSVEDWALSRLKPFAGQHARFDVGPFSFSFAVRSDGSLHGIESLDQPQVTIRLPDDTPLRWLTNRDSIFQAAHISGSADFAEALGFVARNIRWDAEADLARLVGDLPAHRLTLQAQAWAAQTQDTAARLAANLSEYVVDEEALIVRPQPLSSFCSEVDRLRDDVARLEKRLSRL